MSSFEQQLEELKTLAGVSSYNGLTPYSINRENISHTAQEKADHQKKKKIQPGTEAWFKLWFSKPFLTGENPFN